jgi:large subunit ribosomal protein L28
MAKECAVCGKKPITGNNVSHYHKASKRRWLPNLQRIKININGEARRVRVCTSCIRSGFIEKAV